MGHTVERQIMYDVLEEALALEQGQVFDDKSLSVDYGAEPIDYLDMEFRVRQRLGTEIGDFRVRLQAPLESEAPPFKSMPDTPARIVELIERSRQKKRK